MDASGSHSRLIGRAGAVADVRALLGSSRLVTLAGFGGVGKTRLADALIVDPGIDDLDATWLVELAGLADPGLLRNTVAAGVGLPAYGADGDLNALAAYVGPRRVLLVLDNCEHLLAAVAALVSTLIAQCPALTVLTTSRIPLNLGIETVYQVPPLSTPPMLPDVSAADLTGYDAVTLFVERAAAHSAFTLDDENAAAVAELVTALDGFPLAVELAAARAGALSPEVLLERWSDLLTLLGSGFRDSPDRQRSLAASVDWSYRLCTEAEQALWRRLSVFSGGFDLDAAEHVCAGGPIAAEDVLGLLASLVDKSVLARVPDHPRRYRMLEPLRQFGDALLRDLDDPDVWRRGHLDWYADLIGQLEQTWIGPDQAAWLDRLRGEHPNLRAALEMAVAAPGTAPIALVACVRLTPYWVAEGLFGEGRWWAQRALVHASGEPGERATALTMCAWFALMDFDLDEAAECLDRAEPLVELADNEAVRGYHRFNTALLDVCHGNLVPAIEAMLAAIPLIRTGQNAVAELQALFFTGFCLGMVGRTEEGEKFHHVTLAVTEPRGELLGSGYAAWALGMNAIQTGDDANATRWMRQALRSAVALGDSYGTVHRLDALAVIAAHEGRAERAATLFGCAGALWQVIGVAADAIPVVAQVRHEGADRVRAELGDAFLEASFAAGLAMPLEDAIALALEEPQRVPEPDLPLLTRRESEVARLVADGLSNRDIASTLFLSERTAQGHVQNILRKLDVNSRAQIATWVVRRLHLPGQVEY